MKNSLFQSPSFLYYLSARFLALCGNQMIAVALGQYLYERTHNPLHLGYLGLSLFLPKILFTLLAGHVADQYNRRDIIVICRLLQFLIMGLIYVFYLQGFSPLSFIYILLFIMGAASTFDGPSGQSLLTQLIPEQSFAQAVTWNAWAMQMAFILSPVAAGFLYATTYSPRLCFQAILVLRLLSFLLAIGVKAKKLDTAKEKLSWSTVFAGLHFIWQKKILLGILSLDLFAVLLGGAVALIPIFANDILKIGPQGLGFLRAAPALGAASMSLFLAFREPIQKAGKSLFVAVGLFGFFTILFALSTHFYLSLFCLFSLGASDMISVVIRGVLVQTETPAQMRGRVSAVNLIFINASNELGEFESGATAAWFGVIPSVLLGGIGTLAVVALWSKFFPEMKNYGALQKN
ncbi:MAG: MFS transporter [Deltaproteobacteria bacterium]|nr:MFS transporter [Deltaproteobacteria bacterium]